MRPSLRALVRIGWRDARRHRASSVLIAVLVALPVLAVAAGAVLAATDAAAVERYRRADALGAADAVVEVADAAAEQAVRDRLPAGASAVTVRGSQVRVDVGGAGRWVAALGPTRAIRCIATGWSCSRAEHRPPRTRSRWPPPCSGTPV